MRRGTKKNYMKKSKNLLANNWISLVIILFTGQYVWSQGNFTGNIESTFQYLNDDPVINAIQPPSKGLV
ncbi:MAG: hypothetical protein ACK56I_02870, partial [bacterium]